MKITCRCGELIHDTTDDLPQKGHLIPDQEWFATWDALDDELIDPLLDGRLDRGAARALARHLLNRSTRLLWQCSECGRLYLDDAEGRLHCYAPEDAGASLEILRSRPPLG